MLTVALVAVVALWLLAGLLVALAGRPRDAEIDRALAVAEPVVRPLEVVGSARRRSNRAA